MDRGTFARLRPLAKDVRLQITNQWAEQRWTQLLSEDRIKAVPWIHLVKVVGEVDFCLFVVGDFEVEVTLDGFTVGTLATCCCSFRWCQMKCLFKVWSQHIFTDVGLPYMWEHGAFILCKCSSIFIPIFFPLRFVTPKKYRFEVQKSTVDAFGLEDISQSCARSLVVILYTLQIHCFYKQRITWHHPRWWCSKSPSFHIVHVRYRIGKGLKTLSRGS